MATELLERTVATEPAAPDVRVAPDVPAGPATAIFVSCIESGRLEDETVRLAFSLRRWGGRFSRCPMLAVSPRPDVPLRPATKRALRAADVELIRHRRPRRYGWFPFLNKIHAMVEAERRTADGVIVWLDSDMLIVEEPSVFELADGTDIGTCAGSRHGGTIGPTDKNEALWTELCRILGLRIHDLPWVDTELDRQRVRFYLNSGMCAYRAEARFGAEFLDCMVRVLDARLSSRTIGVSLIEQAVFGLAILRAGLRYEIWPERYNFNMVPELQGLYAAGALGHTSVVHYHRWMMPEHWEGLLALVERDRPELLDWLRQLGPVRPAVSGRSPRGAVRLALQASRLAQRRLYEKVLATKL